METVEAVFNSFSVFDLIALGVMFLLALRCVFRGFIKEVFSLAGLVGGIILGRLYYQDAAGFFRPWIERDVIQNVLGFAVICIGVIVITGVASWLISLLIKRTFLGLLDRVAGFCVGAVQGLLLVGVFVMIVSAFAGSVDDSFLDDSVLVRPILSFMNFISGIVFSSGTTESIA